LLKNNWMHWFDSIDLIATADTCQLRIVTNCPDAECPLVEAFLSSFAKSQSLGLDAQRNVPAPTDGCPDFVFKSSPEHVVKLAREIASTGGIRCVTLCYNGVVHGYISDDSVRRDRIQSLVSQFADQLQAIGGDWHSRHLPAAAPSAVESEWISRLVQESNIS
jgi:hypothetical protein